MPQYTFLSFHSRKRGITNTSFESESVTTCAITNLRQFFFKTFLEFSKGIQSRVSKHRIQLSLAVKDLVCFIYFKELLEIGARLIQIAQVLQIGAKLLLIGVAPVVTNWGNSY